MSEACRNDMYRDAGQQKRRRVHVAKIVKTGRRNACPDGKSWHQLTVSGWIGRPSTWLKIGPVSL
jgi:hypothetical protein